MVEFPAHKLVSVADMFTIGIGFTVIVTLAAFEQPFNIPVTVNVVVVAGVTETWQEFPSPWFHEYNAAPLAVSVTEVPAQIWPAVVEMLTIGLTVTPTLAVAVHPASVPVTV